MPVFYLTNLSGKAIKTDKKGKKHINASAWNAGVSLDERLSKKVIRKSRAKRLAAERSQA